MRDNSWSAMLRMPSLLESRNCLLHLWASLGRESIQPRYPPMDIGSSLNPELCHWETATSWQSSWADWRTNKTPYCPYFEKEMHQQGFWKNSRPLPERFNISWIATRHWTNWRSMHPDGQGRAERFLTYRMSQDEYFRYKKDWWISINTSGRNEPMKLRSDFSEAYQQNCTVFTVSLEKSDSHRFLPGNTRNGICRLLHPAHHGGSGKIPGGAQKNHECHAHLSSWKSGMSNGVTR